MTSRTALTLGGALVALAGLGASATLHAATPPAPYKHVLLLNIDGMHAVDFEAWKHYARFGIGSDALRGLALSGITFLNAQSPVPSNDLPGMIAEVTGSTPKSSGVYNDRGFDRTYYAPNSGCTSSVTGAAAIYDQSIDVDPTQYDGGGTLGQPLTQIDTTKLPQRFITANGSQVCQPVLPHLFLNVNTVFQEVKRQIGAGARTAWIDSHPAYEMLNVGGAIDDLYTPEIKSVANSSAGTDYTQSYIDARRFDTLSVQALLNQIDGYASTDNNHNNSVGVPTLFGMSFEEVAVGQQLAQAGPSDPTSRPDDQSPPVGGYLSANPNGAKDGKCVNPGFWNTALVSEQYLTPTSHCMNLTDPLTDLAQLDYVAYEFLQIVNELTKQNLMPSTLIIISAKNGNSPINRKSLMAVSSSLYTPLIKTASANYVADYDDVSLIWLNPRTQTIYNTVQSKLTGSANKLHLQALLNQNDLAAMYASPFTDPRVPDFIGETLPGTIYLNPGETVSTVIAKHGGLSNDDRNVMLVISGTTLGGGAGIINADPVETRQIAPTILSALGLGYTNLQGAAQEGTQPLPVSLH